MITKSRAGRADRDSHCQIPRGRASSHKIKSPHQSQQGQFAAPFIPACRPTTGLSRDFNSLDAQHDAAQAYIRSQAHAGCVGANMFGTGKIDTDRLREISEIVRQSVKG
jgi:hypothetical protein